ncbi:glycosyltransferase, partial [Thermoflexus sp.]|uniref:glycosyltransferase n=1 Tax=Thermoflexus sp. TaxID=1969742 RepID=UPI003A0FDF29
MGLRLALTVNNAQDVLIWRQALVRALLAAEIEVAVVAPPGPAATALTELGCRVFHYPIDRWALSPVTEARSLMNLYGIYRQWRPVIAHHFTIKPNFYGTLAARLSGVPVAVATVTGL